MNANLSDDGIRDDLAWMAWIGIGGMHNFEATLGTPMIVNPTVSYLGGGCFAAW